MTALASPRLRTRWEVYYVDPSDGSEWTCGVYTRRTWADEFAVYCTIHRTFSDHPMRVRRVEVLT